MVKSNDDPNRDEIHAKTVEILKPDIDELYKMIEWVNAAVQRFCDEIKRFKMLQNANGELE